jgi:hypothetical protein
MKPEKKNAEFQNFQNALSRVLRVSHSELQQRIEADKKARATKREASSSDRETKEKG